MDRTNYETVCGITLNRIFGYEPAAARNLISHFGSPGAVFSQDADALDAAFGPYSKYRGLINGRELEASSRELETLKSAGARFVLHGEPGYPPLLSECPDAPVGLYLLSSSPPGELFKGRDCISVVGTRDISPYGKEWTERIVGEISRAPSKPMIISGFAIGVDITAQLAALAFGLPTTGVLPVGIDDIYPQRHRIVAEKLLDTPGCALITDFPPGTGPVPFNFLRRNRIIAGASRATILTESKAKGGGTMTARLAAGYGRELFCLPGRIDDTRSEGCNLLIQEKLAEILAKPSEIAAQLGLGSTWKGVPELETMLRSCYGTTRPELLGKLTEIALCIRKHRGITTEEVSRKLSISYGEVAAFVNLLESDGFVSVDLLQRCCIDNKKAYLCT